MCGILGQINITESINVSLFNEMRDTLSHRGPDGGSSQFLNGGKVALGHRRLSIIDLSEDGTQPMTNENSTIWLTFNGEIYNYKELTSELHKLGHIFISQTDSEVLIHGYEEWGIEGLLSKIKGMFAFAIWDQTEKKLFLAKDRFGIKPLYFTHSSSYLIFGSEIKSLVKNPLVSRELDFSSIADFLVYRFIPSPNSIFEKVKKLPAAHYLEYSLADNSLSIHKYWNLDIDNIRINKNKLTQRVEELLIQSIQEHLISDVPVGVFLSGGYDSSTLVHFMHQLSYPTQAFSIGFEGWENSEHHAAKIVADKYQAEYHEQILDSEMISVTEKTPFHYDEPLGGSSFLPTFKVSELASKKVKVVLGGDGGDEVFGGYNWYHKIMAENTGFFKSLKNKVKSSLNGYQDPILQQYFWKMSWAGYTYQEVKELIHIPRNRHIQDDNLWLYKKYDLKTSNLKRLQNLDFHTFLPELILPKVDRASMAYSIEVRVPFLDHKLVEFLMGLDYRSYFSPSTQKFALHQIIKNHLPAEIMNKKKQGFGGPKIAPDNINYILDTVLRGNLISEGIISKQKVSEFIQERNIRKIWPLFILQLWYEEWAVSKNPVA